MDGFFGVLGLYSLCPGSAFPARFGNGTSRDAMDSNTPSEDTLESMTIKPLLLRCARSRPLYSSWAWQSHVAASPYVADKTSGEGNGRPAQQRRLTVLAMETSCDDTSVAILERRQWSKQDGVASTDLVGPKGDHKNAHEVIFHDKITSNNDAYNGIHPLVALESHRRNLAGLVQRALKRLHLHRRDAVGTGKDVGHHERKRATVFVSDQDDASRSIPDLVAVTRGPGMRSNLAVGLDTAKGLAVAWNVPLIGVHHMQAHALTPRLVFALENSLGPSSSGKDDLRPSFPFLSVLVSGGHTLLIDSHGLTNHAIAAETQDIAIGDCLDKAARVILPPSMLKTPFAKALEELAFHSQISTMSGAGSAEADTQDSTSQAAADMPPVSVERCEHSPDYDYIPPVRRQDELEHKQTRWGWALGPPLSESNGREKSSRRMMFSFAGLLSFVERVMKHKLGPNGTPTTEPRYVISLQERQMMAREVQRVAFEHLASRIMLFLKNRPDWAGDTVVVSGGVASNRFLRHLLRSVLDARGYRHIKLSFPPIELCTDNALMIAWAGLEMFDAGYTSDLTIGPIRKWSLDQKAEDGGILGAEGWLKDQDSKRSNHLED